MLASLVLAAALPLALWPADAGAAVTVVDEVEFYLVEPDEDYYILAVQPLPAPLAKPDPMAVKRLATLAARLGADAVLLLAELDEAAIPDDLDEPLPPGEQYVAAVFVAFDAAADEEQSPQLTAAGAQRGSRVTSVNPRRADSAPARLRRERNASNRGVLSISTTSGRNAATGTSRSTSGLR